MIKIKIEQILEDKQREIRKVLIDAVSETFPELEYIDEYILYKQFIRAVRRRFNSWLRVSDRFVNII